MKTELGETTTTRSHCHTAILLYGQNETTTAVRHSVNADASGKMTLGPGDFVTGSFIVSLLEAMNHSPLQYVPPNVIALARNAIAWFEPPSIQRMLFTPQDDLAVSAFDTKHVPQPALVFLGRPGQLSVFALATDERPTLDTPLYFAPYWNVYQTHQTCIGSMKLPDTIDTENTSAWTRAFFGSNFTHLSSSKRWEHPGTYSQLLQDATTAGRFDPAWLKPAGVTIKEAILCTR